MNSAPVHWLNAPLSSPYRWTMLGAIALSVAYWLFRSRREPLLLPVYIGALGGAFLGAKLAYLFAEGWGDWQQPDRWTRLLAGKSVIGGLLGGYGGVEWMKRLIGYQKATGDAFALILPLALALGRVGCIFQGCCQGNPTSFHFLSVADAAGMRRWPASEIELVFQLAMFVVIVWLARRGLLAGRRFFLYLACYGAFRFIHEFFRDTPKILAGISGYQVLSLVCFIAGAMMFRRRQWEKVDVA